MAHQRNKSRPTAPTSESPAVTTSDGLHLPPVKEKSTSSLPNRNVDDTDNQKLQSQNAALSGELNKLRQENEALIFINREFRKEQDKLYEELKRNRSFQLPRTLQLTAR
ncbi:10223_t:CDS:2, partial [Funneliformis caledonium]